MRLATKGKRAIGTQQDQDGSRDRRRSVFGRHQIGMREDEDGVWLDGRQVVRTFNTRIEPVKALVEEGEVAASMRKTQVIRRSGKGSTPRSRVFYLLEDLDRLFQRRVGTEPVEDGEVKNAASSLGGNPLAEKLAPQLAEALRRTKNDKRLRSEFCSTHLPRIVRALQEAFPDEVERAFALAISFKKPEVPGMVPVPKNRSWPLMAKEIEECCLAMVQNGWVEIGIRLGDKGFSPRTLGDRIIAWEKEYKTNDGGTARAVVHAKLPYMVALFVSDRPLELSEAGLDEPSQGELRDAEGMCRKYSPGLSEFDRNLTYRLGNGN